MIVHLIYFRLYNILINKFSCLDSVEGVKLLIENGANVNAANKYGTTALMAAAKNGS